MRNQKKQNKIQKSVKSKNAIDQVFVDMPSEEKTQFNIFFGLKNMKGAFLIEYPAHTRKRLDDALANGTCKLNLLKDMRSFVEEHKDEVSEFIKDSQSDAA